MVHLTQTCKNLSSTLLHQPARRHQHILSRSFGTATSNGLILNNGASNQQPLSWIWLRDSCRCPECIHPSTTQKLHRSSDIASNISPLETRFTGSSLEIAWPSRETPHTSTYSKEWLHANSSKIAQSHLSVPSPCLWDAKTLESSDGLFHSFSSLQKDQSCLQKAMHHLLTYGIIFVQDIPSPDLDNESEASTRKLASLFGDIRSTFYGPLWDVKSIPQSKNIAYTNLNLDLHMDLLYFESPPRFQVLHALRNRVEGGTSIFVDAFQRAQELFRKDQRLFDVLSKTAVPFQYHNDGLFYYHLHPTIELSQTADQVDQRAVPQISYINYSPPFQAPLPLDSSEGLHQGLKQFVSLLEVKESRFEHTLQEGEAVVFDNRRTLHARTAFHSSSNGVARWLKGCYLECDPLFDRWRRLQLGKNL